MAKPNPIIESYRQRFEVEHRAKRDLLNQITLAACCLAAHDVLGMGPGRAPRFLHAYAVIKTKIAKNLCEDVGDSHRSQGLGDPEFLHTRHDIARALQQTFGPGWEECRQMFPMLRDFWEVDG